MLSPMPNPVLGSGGFHHIALRTSQWERTLAFYCDTLGCQVKITWGSPGERAVMMDTGDGNYIEVFEDLNYSAAPNGRLVHFSLRTTRLDAVTERVRAAGLRITVEPKEVRIQTTNGAGIVPVRISFCEGPNGEIIEFFENTLL